MGNDLPDIPVDELIRTGNRFRENFQSSRYDLLKGVAFGYCLGRVSAKNLIQILNRQPGQTVWPEILASRL